jgi:hypothetical protein
VTGYIGDFRGDTGVTRYYFGTRETGSPAD